MQELDTQSVDIALHVRNISMKTLYLVFICKMYFQSTKKKARRPLSRVVSFANMIMESPGKALHVSNRFIGLCCIIIYYLSCCFISGQSA